MTILKYLSSKSLLRAYARGQAIFELDNKKVNQKIPGAFLYCRKAGMTFIMWILISSVSMMGTVKAECTPTSDCASIGYTHTSCDGKFVRCPFDTSKLFCIPCDNDYKYSCSSNNIVGGIGSSCNRKYISCECSVGYIFNEGGCLRNCTVGMIYYTDKSCSSIYDSSKTVVGIVVKDNELIMSRPVVMTWSNAYLGGMSETSGQWYLPATGEVYAYLYGNYNVIDSTFSTIGWSLDNYYFWTSCEHAAYYGAWNVHINGYFDGKDKHYSFSVTCFLEI